MWDQVSHFSSSICLSHPSVTIATGFYQNTLAVVGNELFCFMENVQSHYNRSHLHNN